MSIGKALFCRQLKTGITAGHDVAGHVMGCKLMDNSAVGEPAFMEKRAPGWR